MSTVAQLRDTIRKLLADPEAEETLTGMGIAPSGAKAITMSPGWKAAKSLRAPR